MTTSIFFAILVTSLATFLSRFLGVITSENIKENSKIFRWFNCLAYSTLAALIARIIILPSGVLSEVDYLIRFTFLFLTLCSSSFYAFSNQLDRVAVIVNDGVVLESDIQLKVREYKKNAALEGQSIPGDEALRETVVEQLILDELQLQIADRVGIKISDEELNLTLKTLAQQNNLSLEDFISFVENQGDSYAQLREDVKKGLKIQKEGQKMQLESWAKLIIEDLHHVSEIFGSNNNAYKESLDQAMEKIESKCETPSSKLIEQVTEENNVEEFGFKLALNHRETFKEKKNSSEALLSKEKIQSKKKLIDLENQQQESFQQYLEQYL